MTVKCDWALQKPSCNKENRIKWLKEPLSSNVFEQELSESQVLIRQRWKGLEAVIPCSPEIKNSMHCFKFPLVYTLYFYTLQFLLHY